MGKRNLIEHLTAFNYMMSMPQFLNLFSNYYLVNKGFFFFYLFGYMPSEILIFRIIAII